MNSTMTASELLDALDKAGAADATIRMGRDFLRDFQGAGPDQLIAHFEGAPDRSRGQMAHVAPRVTTGTIAKAKDILSGRKTPDDYQGVPPKRSQESHEARLAQLIAGEIGKVFQHKQDNQFERQIEAETKGIGNPARKPAGAVSAVK
jgi:hypothetical protein